MAPHFHLMTWRWNQLESRLALPVRVVNRLNAAMSAGQRHSHDHTTTLPVGGANPVAQSTVRTR